MGGFALLSTVLTGGHAVQGTFSDTGISIAAQESALVGLRNGFVVGNSQAEWPIDPNGYIFQTQFGQNFTTNPSTAAGGIDLLETTFSGSGNVGGGFSFRSTGMRIEQNGQVQTGYGKIDGTTGGLVISSQEQTLSGTPTLAAGGTGFVTNGLAADAYGNIVRVTASGGAVTAIAAVVTRGWTSTPPSNPVAFVAITGNNPATGNIGTGLTLNETWAGSANIALGAGADALQVGGSAMIAANDSVATALSSVGPVGSHTTVQEWLAVKNPSGTVRYIPMF